MANDNLSEPVSQGAGDVPQTGGDVWASWDNVGVVVSDEQSVSTPTEATAKPEAQPVTETKGATPLQESQLASAEETAAKTEPAPESKPETETKAETATEQEEEPQDYEKEYQALIETEKAVGKKAYLGRLKEDATFTRMLKDSNTDVMDVLEYGFNKFPNRMHEMTHGLVHSSITHPEYRDGWLQHAVKEIEGTEDVQDMTYTEAIKAVRAFRSGEIKEADTGIDWNDPSNDELLSPDARALAQKLREQDAKLQKLEPIDKKVQELETQKKQEDERVFNTKTQEKFNQYQGDVEKKLLSRGFQKYGLNVLESDTEEVKAVKTYTQSLFQGDEKTMSDLEVFALDGSFSQKEALQKVYADVKKNLSDAAFYEIKGDTKRAEAAWNLAKEQEQTIEVLVWNALNEFVQQTVNPILTVVRKNAELEARIRELETRPEITTQTGVVGSSSTFTRTGDPANVFDQTFG